MQCVRVYLERLYIYQFKLNDVIYSNILNYIKSLFGVTLNYSYELH